MCEKCNGIVRSLLLSQENNDMYCSAYLSSRNLVIDIEGSDWYQFEIEINFCPKCGRDLRGESDGR